MTPLLQSLLISLPSALVLAAFFAEAITPGSLRLIFGPMQALSRSWNGCGNASSVDLGTTLATQQTAGSNAGCEGVTTGRDGKLTFPARNRRGTRVVKWLLWHSQDGRAGLGLASIRPSYQPARRVASPGARRAL